VAGFALDLRDYSCGGAPPNRRRAKVDRCIPLGNTVGALSMLPTSHSGRTSHRRAQRHHPEEDRMSRTEGRIRCAQVALATLAATAMACADPPSAVGLDPVASADTRAGDLPAYEVESLGTLGGSFSIAFGINDAGEVAGGANDADEIERSFLWRNGTMINAGSLGGNGNSGLNARGELAGFSETTDPDPNGEDVCGLGTHRVCLPTLWRNGTMRALPTLGGVNAVAVSINDRGQAVGAAETAVRDLSCAAGMPFQAYRYEAAVWEKSGEVRALPPLAGDEVSLALWSNARDQVVGSSGSCARSTIAGLMGAPHAVLWDRGVAIPLDPPGSDHLISAGASINDAGVVVGGTRSDVLHSFMWTRATGKRDIGTVEQDLGSFATGINAKGQVVGASCVNDATCDITNPELQSRAYLWQNGVMRDLNSLVAGNTSLYLIIAQAINDKGQIVGLAFDGEIGQPRAFLATPVRKGGGMQAMRAPVRPTALPALVRAEIRWGAGTRSR
jgi:probable HAF family extracellular repeat protein